MPAATKSDVRGRPPLTEPPLPPEVRTELIRYASTGSVTDKLLAEAAGVAPTTWTSWKARTEPGFVDFFAEIEHARTKGKIALIAAVRKQGLAGDWKALKYLLSVTEPDYSERRGETTINVETNVAAGDGALAVGGTGLTEQDLADAAEMLLRRSMERDAAARAERRAALAAATTPREAAEGE